MHKWVETLIATCLYYTGLVKLARWWTRRSGQRLAILCYHQATGGDLRQHLLYLRRHYRILHLEAALEELHTPYKSEPPGKGRRTPLVLTFDDGNRDNYTQGFKLARELQIPITMFLIPGYIESGSRFWWLEGAHLVSHAQVSEATIEGRTYRLNNLDERRALAQAIDTRVRNAPSVFQREELLLAAREMLAEPSAGIADESNTSPITWAEVQEMEASGWVSFGAHTMHHPILAYLADPVEVQYEVSESRAVLEQKLGHPVRSFAYPVGLPEHIGENGLRAVRKAGYDWAVSTLPGFNTLQTDPFLLRRHVVDAAQHWLLVAAKVSGVWSFFLRLYLLPITLIRNTLITGKIRAHARHDDKWLYNSSPEKTA